jgi:hypothetical protein
MEAVLTAPRLLIHGQTRVERFMPAAILDAQVHVIPHIGCAGVHQ